MKKIGIVVKPDANAVEKAKELERWFRDKGLDVVQRPLREVENTAADASHAPADIDCVFVLGGDGTFLSAIRWIGDLEIPVLGVKFGEIGFLAETTEDRLTDIAECILQKRFETVERMRLQAVVVRSERIVAAEMVMNDIVVNKGALARLADIATYIDDHYLTTYRADGLILATPTGSTAYSLAAGGPVMHPAVPGILMTPICPFTLTNRPLIVPDSVTIRIELAENSSDMMLTFDGQKGFEIRNGDSVLVRKAAHPVRMIRIPDQPYFDVLKAKLRWSGGRY